MEKVDLERLLGEYERLRAYMDNVPDLICFKDIDCRYVQVNYALADLVGSSPGTMRGRRAEDFLPAAWVQSEAADEAVVRRTGKSAPPAIVGLAERVGPFFSSTTIPWYDSGGAVQGTICVLRDITDLHVEKLSHRDRARMQEILFGLLEISLHELPLAGQLEQALDLILGIPWLPLEPRGGVFLVGEDGQHLVLVAQRNLAAPLLVECARLPFGRCLCGRAAKTREIVFAAEVDDRHEVTYDGIEAHGHYCVPVLAGDRLLGVIVLYTHAGHEQSPTQRQYLQALADALAGLVERSQAADRIRQAEQTQTVLNDIIAISVEPLAMTEQLHRILDRIFEIPWIALERKGCVFLVDEEQPKTLLMVAQRGIGPPIVDVCARLEFGHCLCGRAAATRKLVFRGHAGADHEVRFPEMSDHGHYCLPILSGDHLLGVLNLYVSAGHLPASRDETFLNSVANTLAGIVERKRAEEALRHMASYDSLTGLANRALFSNRLELYVREASRYAYMFAVLYLDLDRFKPINDTLGHAAGDRLLAAVASRLKAAVRQSDTVARLGGDEFAIILARVAQASDAAVTAERVLRALSEPFDLGDLSREIGASIGIAVFPEHGQQTQTLLRSADLAMYSVKRAGTGDYRFAERPDVDPANGPEGV